MERALLVDVHFKKRTYQSAWPTEFRSQELRELSRSCGLDVQEIVSLQREKPAADTLIGKGKAQDLHQICHDQKIDVVVFGQDLSFPQQRNLEEILGLKLIDRTQLILDIFAQRAHSQEGKVQVELAQLQYMLPRLAGKGILLSRLGGGIGTRGPGEKKLEVDRRRIRLRINRLNQDLREVAKRRTVARQKRLGQDVPTAALVGYTNAGKTTLLNQLTDAGAFSKDLLFTTLDPLARRLLLPNHQPVLLSDTVGFLHQLPHHLIEAFKATLEEVVQAHLLLHVMDASDPMLEYLIAAVEEVLSFLGVAAKPGLVVLNKVDQIDSDSRRRLMKRFPDAVLISAQTGEGIDQLQDRLISALASLRREALIWIVPKDQSWVEKIYDQGQVISREIQQEGVQYRALVPHRLYGQLQKAGLTRSSS